MQKPIPPGSAPTWFSNMQDGSWSTVASSADQQLDNVLQSPMPNAGSDHYSSITAAWTGGAVDQSRGEFLLVANGGHADYAGNEGYSISLRDAVPAWRRMNDSTPNSQMVDYAKSICDATACHAANPGKTVNGCKTYDDGRPRAMHSTFEVFGDGRVWYPLQNAYTSPAGDSGYGIVSFNRNYIEPVTGRTLDKSSGVLPWTAANIGPWELWGPIDGTNSQSTGLIFGRGVFDPVDHKIWGLAGSGANYSTYWSIESQGANLGRSKIYRSGQSGIGQWSGWTAVAPELRVLIAGDIFAQKITVLDLTNPEAGWQIVTNESGPNSGSATFGYYGLDSVAYARGGSSAVYIKANNTLAIGDPRETGSSIWKLKVPTKIGSNGLKIYDRAGQWIWSKLSPPGTGPTAKTDTGTAHGAYGKWNIIEDMGNGQSALIFIGQSGDFNSIKSPVYVYKIPIDGI